ncbi:MAG: sigma-54-dependent Fis family transcriptional regulator, partial [Candidatus Cloacimonetes bacterium]|nr:sigma-54-dependent Fis family transcriptional regulator [Candidatus Cloacimonadota bacterium]
RLKAADATLPVILITAHAGVDAAVEAMKAGAQDFLTKPIDYTTLHVLLESVAREIREQEEVRRLQEQLTGEGASRRVIGHSRPMREVLKTIDLLAGSDASEIITGESGTGKEVVARAIHEMSARRNGPFLALNAAAIPDELVESELFGHEQGAFTGATRTREGCFEMANGGTLFLDEIAEMPVHLQPKLLRVLEEGSARRIGGAREIPFDVRVIAATNRDPAIAVREGRLREDLFYRLSVFSVVLPPLRERSSDIPLLAQYFIGEFNTKHGASVHGVRAEAMEILRNAPWPGNVRELRNVIERAVIIARSGWIEPRHLPPYLRSESSGDGSIRLRPGITLAEAERTLILETLARVGNNKAAAARELGVDVKTVRNKLKAYGHA